MVQSAEQDALKSCEEMAVKARGKQEQAVTEILQYLKL